MPLRASVHSPANLTGVFASWKEEGSVVGDETEENTAFMWDQLKATGLNEWLSRESGPLTIISDRGKAILSGVRRAMPQADVIFCCFHLLCNINQHCKGIGISILMDST